MNNWKPINTAPKNGKKFLAYCENGTIMTLNEPKGHALGAWTKQGSRWSGTAVSWPKPTHWMPMPPSPSA